MCQAQGSKLPLLLACTACSKNTHVASDLARVMDSEGFAKQISPLTLINSEPVWVKQIQSGRPIMVIDGCDQCCMQRILTSYSLSETWYINLYNFGFDHNIDGMYKICQLNSVVRFVQQILSSAQR